MPLNYLLILLYLLLLLYILPQRDPAGLDPESRWEAASRMRKYDDMYELSLSFQDGKTGQVG